MTATDKQKYVCLETGFFLGKHYMAGAEEMLYPRQVEGHEHRWGKEKPRTVKTTMGKAAAKG